MVNGGIFNVEQKLGLLIKYHYSGCDFNSFVYGNIKHKSLAVTESYVMCVLRVCLSHGPLFRADGSHLPLIGQCPTFQTSDIAHLISDWCSLFTGSDVSALFVTRRQ